MAQAQDNGSKQAAGQHVEEPPGGQSAQELLDAWYASVQQELEGADADGQTIGLLGGRSSGAQGPSRRSKLRRIGEMLAIVRRYDIFHGLTPKTLRRNG